MTCRRLLTIGPMPLFLVLSQSCRSQNTSALPTPPGWPWMWCQAGAAPPARSPSASPRSPSRSSHLWPTTTSPSSCCPPIRRTSSWWVPAETCSLCEYKLSRLVQENTTQQLFLGEFDTLKPVQVNCTLLSLPEVPSHRVVSKRDLVLLALA